MRDKSSRLRGLKHCVTEQPENMSGHITKAAENIEHTRILEIAKRRYEEAENDLSAAKCEVNAAKNDLFDWKRDDEARFSMGINTIDRDPQLLYLEKKVKDARRELTDADNRLQNAHLRLKDAKVVQLP
jgi:hypothetical protein